MIVEVSVIVRPGNGETDDVTRFEYQRWITDHISKKDVEHQEYLAGDAARVAIANCYEMITGNTWEDFCINGKEVSE